MIPTSPKKIVELYNQVKDLLAANGVKTLASQGELIGRSERSMRAYGDLSDLSYARRIPADDLGKLMRHAIELDIGRIAEVLKAYGIPGNQDLWTGGRRDDAWDLRERWREAEPKALALHTRVDLADMTDLCPYVQIRCGIHYPPLRWTPTTAQVADLEFAAGIDPEKSAANKKQRMSA